MTKSSSYQIFLKSRVSVNQKIEFKNEKKIRHKVDTDSLLIKKRQNTFEGRKKKILQRGNATL